MNEFEISVVNEPSVIEPLNFYCMHLADEKQINDALVVTIFRFSGLLSPLTWLLF